MTMTNRKKLLSLVLCAALAWTVAFGIVGCSDNKTPETPETGTPAVTTTSPADSTAATTEDAAIGTSIGDGNTAFTFTVTDKDGNETSFNIETDKTTVGEALLELGLIEGEMGDYGLYVKKVNGITADFDVDGTYWAFYVNGEYAMNGVDLTEIEDGATYGFKVEK